MSKCIHVILSLKSNSANWERDSRWEMIWGLGLPPQKWFTGVSDLTSHRMRFLFWGDVEGD